MFRKKEKSSKKQLYINGAPSPGLLQEDTMKYRSFVNSTENPVSTAPIAPLTPKRSTAYHQQNGTHSRKDDNYKHSQHSSHGHSSNGFSIPNPSSHLTLPPPRAIDTGIETFERKSIKFWVPTNKLPAAMAVLQRHIPVSRRGMVHSVYLDNTEGHLYSRRLTREDRSKLLRFRWYGPDKPSREVFVELKTHRGGVTSTKERFGLKPQDAMNFMNRSSRVPIPSNARELAGRCSRLITEHGLEPVIRTEYYRTAFEDPLNTDFRASLDQNVTMIGESAFVCNWAHTAKGDDNVFVFPFAILELKIAAHALESSSTTIDSWIQALAEHGGALEVEKFSKFLSAFSALHPSRVRMVPDWMSDPNVSSSLQARHLRPAASSPDDVDPIFFNRSQTKARSAEPKAYLAVERTMLSWIRTIMIIYGVSTYLLIEPEAINGTADDVMGWIGFAFATILIVYAFSQYKKRNRMLVNSTNPVEFQDPIGTGLLLASILLSGMIGAVVFQKPIF